MKNSTITQIQKYRNYHRQGEEKIHTSETTSMIKDTRYISYDQTTLQKKEYHYLHQLVFSANLCCGRLKCKKDIVTRDVISAAWHYEPPFSYNSRDV